MSKNKKLVYQIFDCKKNTLETRSVSVNNKETARLVMKGIKAEQDSVMRDARMMFTHAINLVIKKWYARTLGVEVRSLLEEKRPGVTKGVMQKVDILLKTRTQEYAIVFDNIAYSHINSHDYTARQNHIYKTFKGNVYTFTFKDFMSAAVKASKYAKELRAVLVELKDIGMIKPNAYIPSELELTHCFDVAIEATVNGKAVLTA